MQYRQDYSGSKADFIEFLRNTFQQMISSSLSVEGENVLLPNDKEMDYKVKYTTDEEESSITIKVSWGNNENTDNIDD